ncbi:transposase [Microbispora sp. RL4-1S]|uniref:Transposase n=1 Tax=Microbispora oryzae TaxID=2806554 RepID=A0A940WGJ2_9ACTN|nr:transposase [Microbispora oryzae]MBP2704378.1 transposase [Microbispora oryzae]
MSKWVGVDGWTVDLVRLNGRPLLRVRHLGYHVAYCASPAELARHIDLADLVEVVALQT